MIGTSSVLEGTRALLTMTYLGPRRPSDMILNTLKSLYIRLLCQLELIVVYKLTPVSDLSTLYEFFQSIYLLRLISPLQPRR